MAAPQIISGEMEVCSSVIRIIYTPCMFVQHAYVSTMCLCVVKVDVYEGMGYNMCLSKSYYLCQNYYTIMTI